ncbi:Hypothetical predicted protein [Lecanosticta acicola]|uniref:Uncharacterized protein n=1 Tax=Lecanosticta acicola TaxID=111012 RepID=A0AAI9EFW8_9PEZI|nr:Hypothetical predicted protein [Lecanosticta acicola]
MENDSAATDKSIRKPDRDMSRSDFEVLGVVPSNALDTPPSNAPESSTSEMNVPAKLKEKGKVVSKSSKSHHHHHHHHHQKDSENLEPGLEKSDPISPPPPDDNEKQISRLPEDDYDSETQGDIPPPGEAIEKHDSGTAGSDFEVGGLIGMRSDDSGRKSPVREKKPQLERHISAIPQSDDEEDAGAGGGGARRRSRLERTISRVPQD